MILKFGPFIGPYLGTVVKNAKHSAVHFDASNTGGMEAWKQENENNITNI